MRIILERRIVTAQAKRASFLTQLAVENVKSFLGSHLLDLTDEEGRPARWTLILGDNGVGKTTLLECLAHLAPVFNSDDKLGSAEPEMFVEPRIAAAENSVIENLGRNGDFEVKIAATFAVDSCLNAGEVPTDIVETWMTFSRTNGKSDNIKTSEWGKEKRFVVAKWKEFSKFEEPLILAYGAGRHMGVENLDFSHAPEATESLLQGTVELFDAEQLLQQIDYASLLEDAGRAKRQKQILLEMIAALLPEVEHASNIKIYPPTALGAQGKSGVYVCTSDGEVRLRQLSFGYQTMMAWLSDIGWRLFNRYPDSPNPFHEPAIILVDEIDLHLHPKWQRQLRERLTLHFPNVQFIATAHSPLMVQAFLDANLAVVARADSDDHSIIENDPAVLINWSVDQIVTSDLFGLKTAWPPEVEVLFDEQRELLAKTTRTAEDDARLDEIHKAMLALPTERNPANEAAMAIVREAAALLKPKVARH
jgi:predicted ATP-binding protein involved in virulence